MRQLLEDVCGFALFATLMSALLMMDVLLAALLNVN